MVQRRTFLQELLLLVSQVQSQQLKAPVQHLFSQSYTGDAVPNAAVSLGAAPNFSSVTSYAAGDNTIWYSNFSGALTVTAGGAVLRRLANSSVRSRY